MRWSRTVRNPPRTALGAVATVGLRDRAAEAEAGWEAWVAKAIVGLEARAVSVGAMMGALGWEAAARRQSLLVGLGSRVTAAGWRCEAAEPELRARARTKKKAPLARATPGTRPSQ